MLISEYEQFQLVRLTLILLLQSVHFTQPVKSFVMTLYGKSRITSPLLIRLNMLLIAISKSKISPELQILCCTGKTISVHSSYYQQKILKCSTHICCFRKIGQISITRRNRLAPRYLLTLAVNCEHIKCH